jgi:hypothetical protein
LSGARSWHLGSFRVGWTALGYEFVELLDVLLQSGTL